MTTISAGKIEAEFNFERDTKNTLRFAETDDVPAIGSLYIQKHALKQAGNTQPKTVKVVITIE